MIENKTAYTANSLNGNQMINLCNYPPNNKWLTAHDISE